jgi:hypothetical protein
LFRSTKLLEFYFLFIYIIFRIAPQLYRKDNLFHVEQSSPLQDRTTKKLLWPDTLVLV